MHPSTYPPSTDDNPIYAIAHTIQDEIQNHFHYLIASIGWWQPPPPPPPHHRGDYYPIIDIMTKLEATDNGHHYHLGSLRFNENKIKICAIPKDQNTRIEITEIEYANPNMEDKLRRAITEMINLTKHPIKITPEGHDE